MLETVQQGVRHALRAAGQKDRRTRYARRPAQRQTGDEGREQDRILIELFVQNLTAAFPGGEAGKDQQAESQREPAAIDNFR